MIGLLSIQISYAQSSFNINDTTANTYFWIISQTNDEKLNELTKEKKIFKRSEIDSLFHLTIEKLENNGYPFSKIKFFTDSVKNYKIYGKLVLDKGKLITIDSIAIKGYNKFPSYLIKRYIQIPKKIIYNQERINNISQKIHEIDFIEEYKKNEILFNPNKNIVYVYLKRKKNNYLDAFLGLNNYNNKIILLGKIHLNISNTINLFENIEFKWNKLNEASQELNFKIQFPYIFNSIFGINSELNILHFENIYNKIDVAFSLRIKQKTSNINIGYLNKKSSVFTENSTNVLSEFHSNFLHIIWEKYGTKKDFSSKHNYNLSIEIGLGNSIIENQKSTRKYGKLSFQILVPFFNSNFIFLKSQNALIIGENILENEKVGIGGQNYLRGFLDNTFFSKSFNIINLENKYFIEENTYISAFYDFGIIHDYDNHLVSSLGIGLGLTLKNDIFSVNYAIPSQNNNFDISDAKLHFNYLIKF
jgi:hypothetical protein